MEREYVFEVIEFSFINFNCGVNRFLSVPTVEVNVSQAKCWSFMYF